MRKTLQSGVVTISILAITGCSSLPGNDSQQGAVIGGASGAAVGAAVTKNRALGAVIGGAVGAAGGYVIGKNKDKIIGKGSHADETSAEQAARTSETSPATPEMARNATTADVNNDGFVTLDEVVAMEQAGLSDDEMIRRLRATNQVFDLTDEQQKYLTDRGVSSAVVNQLPNLNAQTTPSAPPVIGTPRPTI